MADDALLSVRDLRVDYGPVRAVDGVSLTVATGPFGIGLVGESGSGTPAGAMWRSNSNSSAG